MSYYGEDEEDNGAGASSTGAGVGAGAGSYSSPYGAVDEIDIDNGWLTDMFSSSDASLICVLMSLLLLILVLCAFVLQFFVSVFSLSRGDAVALVAVVVLVGIMCYMGAGGVDGDDDMGYLGSYSSRFVFWFGLVILFGLHHSTHSTVLHVLCARRFVRACARTPGRGPCDVSHSTHCVRAVL